MITCTPRDSAALANSFIRSGVRWAETIKLSWGTPKRASISCAWDIVSQSDLEPMMIETRGFAAGLVAFSGISLHQKVRFVTTQVCRAGECHACEPILP